MHNQVDFNVHDITRIRLVDGTEHDVAAVQRQIGPLCVAVAGEADIVIRFVDEVAGASDMRILGDWEAGFDRDRFWILRGNHRERIAVQMPLDLVGRRCEIVCQRSLAAIPLLGSIINLTALAKGHLPLHGSAFSFHGETVLVTGWSKGGKTEALLGFAEAGATYVADEWVYIDAAGKVMYGLPQRIHLWDWHLDSLKHRQRLTRGQQVKLAAIRRLNLVLAGLARWQTPVAKLLRRLAESVHQRRHVRVTPERLFSGRVQNSADCPGRVFFVASHAASTIAIQPISIDEVRARMAVSLEHEFEALRSWYRHFRFAFPGRTNPLLERLPVLLREQLVQSFKNKEGLVVWHPYPVPPRELYEAMLPFVGAKYDSGPGITSAVELRPAVSLESTATGCG